MDMETVGEEMDWKRLGALVYSRAAPCDHSLPRLSTTITVFFNMFSIWRGR